MVPQWNQQLIWHNFTVPTMLVLTIFAELLSSVLVVFAEPPHD